MKKTHNNYCISRGYDIKLKGNAALQMCHFEADTLTICPPDFRWISPKLLVKENDEVQIGTPLFADKNDERVVIVSPAHAMVSKIIRGEKRAVLGIDLQVITRNPILKVADVNPELRDELLKMLLRYGLFPLIRQRPFSIIPNPDSVPKAIFVPCFDSSPLAPDCNFLIKNHFDDFYEGVRRLKMLCKRICLCLNPKLDNVGFEATQDVDLYYFKGPHPAGNVGTQMNRISPINKGETVWYIRPQELAVIGRFFLKKELCFEKMVALTGPCVPNPSYYQMTYGTDCSKLFSSCTLDNTRKICGNVLTGKEITDIPAIGFYDNQLTILPEGGEREFLGWLLPGCRKWSISHTFSAWLTPRKYFPISTSLNGGKRTLVMTDVYDKVFPLDIIPLALLKACLAKDVEMMENLGIYEVDDEDFALCEMICPSKTDWQQIIRDALFYIKNN